jgi:uncharacterized RDD family membrane protein YckC
LFSGLFSDSRLPSQETIAPPIAPPPSPPVDKAETPPALGLHVEPAPEAQAPEPDQAWREELAERVENFRRRRARLKHGTDSSAKLDLNFEKTEDLGGLSPAEAKILEFPRTNAHLDVELGTPSRAESELPVLEASPLEKSEGGLRILSSAAVQAGELPLGGELRGGEREPVEIVVGPPEPSVHPAVHQVSAVVLPLAPMGRRFLAGLADALVLLMGTGLFALIFWRAGGQLRLDSLNLAVLVFIAVFFILAYFGLFTAIASSTPGLLWMECEVRNLEGAHPTTQESFLRAFGYLVSISALMLGFLWALLDSEGLTWHDRMSGTFIVVATAKPGALNSEL